MKLNHRQKIIGDNIILVPYREHHVPRYHEWMQTLELQHLTASEPLNLDQEYDMQKSWLEDEYKCTFIILNKSVYNQSSNEEEAMIGDTNIFLNNQDHSVGEIEIMIAETTARGKKFGWEAVVLMLLYGIHYIQLKKFEAKISQNNVISLKMFEKLGFTEVSRSDVFQEVTLEKTVDDSWSQWLQSQCKFSNEIHD